MSCWLNVIIQNTQYFRTYLPLMARFTQLSQRSFGLFKEASSNSFVDFDSPGPKSRNHGGTISKQQSFSMNQEYILDLGKFLADIRQRMCHAAANQSCPA